MIAGGKTCSSVNCPFSLSPVPPPEHVAPICLPIQDLFTRICVEKNNRSSKMPGCQKNKWEAKQRQKAKTERHSKTATKLITGAAALQKKLVI